MAPIEEREYGNLEAKVDIMMSMLKDMQEDFKIYNSARATCGNNFKELLDYKEEHKEYHKSISTKSWQIIMAVVSFVSSCLTALFVWYNRK